MTVFRIVSREIPTVIEEDTEKEAGQINIEDVAGLEAALAGRVVSRPLTGKRQVLGIYWGPDNEEFVVEVAETAT